MLLNLEAGTFVTVSNLLCHIKDYTIVQKISICITKCTTVYPGADPGICERGAVPPVTLLSHSSFHFPSPSSPMSLRSRAP